MTLLAPLFNALVLGAATYAALRHERKAAARDLLLGGGAAVAALAVLAMVRRYGGFSTTGVPILWRTAAIEELAKWSTVSLPAILPADRRDALRRGLGFAYVEQLFFMLLPPPYFVLRLLLAGGLHVSTTLFYGETRRRAASVHIAALAPAIALHAGYNWLIRWLDDILTVW